MVFVGRDKHDSSQARSTLAWSLDVSNPWPEVAKIAYPRVYPGLVENNRFALTRHMNVRSMKNTRFSGLEMLKGLETRTRSGSNGPSRLLPYLVAPSEG
jgi:hypothetical protein